MEGGRLTERQRFLLENLKIFHGQLSATIHRDLVPRHHERTAAQDYARLYEQCFPLFLPALVNGDRTAESAIRAHIADFVSASLNRLAEREKRVLWLRLKELITMRYSHLELPYFFLDLGSRALPEDVAELYREFLFHDMHLAHKMAVIEPWRMY